MEVDVTLRLADHGVTFATRERAPDILGHLGHVALKVIDFDRVQAVSPSFLDEFFNGLSEHHERLMLMNVGEAIEPMIERVLKRKRLKSRFRTVAVF